MRDIAVLLAVIFGIALTFPYPFAGVLLWTWFTIMSPHEEAYGFAKTAPFNFVLAAVTIAVWLFSKERKIPPPQFIFWISIVFLLWMTLNSFFALFPDWSWPLWDRTWKIFALGLLVAATARSKTRIHAIIWIIVVSLFYYGVKGGLFTLATGGHFRVQGAPGTIIGDNNQLALALLMALPLANYLRIHTQKRWIRLLLAGCTALTFVSIVGSYSRGALLGLVALLCASWFRAGGKLIYVLVAAAVIVPLLYFMPSHFYDRVHTLNSVSTDQSFQGRILAWKIAWISSIDRFPFGAGFAGLQKPEAFHAYFPHAQPHAAHSIFFEVLGDHGFIGLAIYVLILVASFLKCSDIIRKSKNTPELRWAYDLAGMIQLALLVFCVGGAALSMAYYDVFVLCVMLLLPLYELVEKQKPINFGISARNRFGLPANINQTG